MDLCETEHCKSHEYVERTMNRLEEISLRLTDGQAQIISVVQDVSRLGARVEKLEIKQDEIRSWMLKIIGVITAVGFIAPILMSYMLGKIP